MLISRSFLTQSLGHVETHEEELDTPAFIEFLTKECVELRSCKVPHALGFYQSVLSVFIRSEIQGSANPRRAMWVSGRESHGKPQLMRLPSWDVPSSDLFGENCAHTLQGPGATVHRCASPRSKPCADFPKKNDQLLMAIKT